MVRRMIKKKEKKESKADIMSLLPLSSTKKRKGKTIGEEILELLSKPTAKERSLAERFRSQGGTQLMGFCQYGTKGDCERNRVVECRKLHSKIFQKHTVDRSSQNDDSSLLWHSKPTIRADISTMLYPPQWVQCDLRFLDMTVLGKFAVIMADPP
ncbi:hypothetical protein HHI36_002613 [Cryptolaemus montrouzieri]|uniref:Uncharacterized protein n=1 Tax=Cryptolaemus montrouzieri TaxID=559131 RepID=A0ABD2PBK8_9CUCU